MDTIIIPEMEVNTEEDLNRFLDLVRIEMKHSLARMDERGERIDQALARLDEREKRLDELLRNVQTNH